MVRATSLLVLSAAFATAYGHVSESYKQGRVHWKRSPSGQKYPTDWILAPASSNKPEWLQGLNDAIKAGLIPDIPPSKLNAQGNPTYPAGTPDPCNWSLTGCQGKNDIYTAPDGYLGIQFDDGPTLASPTLTNFLANNSIAATHFVIGSNIYDYPDNFDAIFKTPGQHVAVHTWSHNMSTTLSNEVMLAELGWTIQIIYDRSGKIPLWWRAPYGDLDNRIRAIATEVFGMTAVNWNFDSNDWCMEDNGTSDCPGQNPGQSQSSITNYIDQTVSNSTRSPGVIMLEHELTKYSVNAFIQHTWAGVQKYGWKHDNIPGLFGMPWYANSWNNTTPNSSQTSFLKSAIVPGGNSNGSSTTHTASGAAAGTSAAAAAASSTASKDNTKKGAASASASVSLLSMLAVLGGAVLSAIAL